MSFLQIPIGTYPNTFLGYQSSIGITTGTGDTAFGYLTLNANTTGSDNSAFGNEALRFNVSGSRNTAGGATALQINNANNNTAFGYASQRGNVNGQDNSSFGHDSMRAGDDGNENSAFGSGALYNAANTQGNSGFGYLSLYNVTSGLKNSAFGWASGSLITTGSKNSILGSYSGNQGGLDIRTLSNYIVLSDGDGNPRLWIDNTGAVNIPGGFVLPGGTANGVLYLNGSKVVTSGSGLTFDSSGNLGLGVTPSAWGTSAFQTKVASVWGFSNNAYVGCNYYFDGTNRRYIATAAASEYAQFNGQHTWYTAPSGTAGNVISFTQAMTLDASGNLALGSTTTTTLAGYQWFRVNGTTGGAIELTSNNSRVLQMQADGTSAGAQIQTITSSPLIFGTNSTERARIPAAGGMVVGTAALATSATDGFLYVPTCAGTPTGTPTTQTGTAPIVVDTTNNKLYFYSGGQWRDAGP